MKKIKIEIVETLSRIIEIENISEEEAVNLVKIKYSDEEIVLSDIDMVDVEFNVIENNDYLK